jgi:hypothetical protein
MTKAQYLFVSFIVFDSSIYEDICRRTKHVVQGSGVFLMESKGVLRVENVLWVPKIRRSVLSVSKIERKGYHILF